MKALIQFKFYIRYYINTHFIKNQAKYCTKIHQNQEFLSVFWILLIYIFYFINIYFFYFLVDYIQNLHITF
jgi:hypothetical protein